MATHKVVDEMQWLAARRELLQKEKDFTRLRDELSASRRELPWLKVGKEYRFSGKAGELSLADMFAGRSQLLLYHFMFHPDWNEACKSCSFWADGYNAIYPHLAQRDVTLAVVSRAPQKKLQAFGERMGWHAGPGVRDQEAHVEADPRVEVRGQVPVLGCLGAVGKLRARIHRVRRSAGTRGRRGRHDQAREQGRTAVSQASASAASQATTDSPRRRAAKA